MRSVIPSTQSSLSRLGSDPFVSMRKAFDRIFDDFSTDFEDMLPISWSQANRNFTPRLDIADLEDKFVLSAELPGLTDKDVHVEVNKDYLTIRGEKKSEHEEKSGASYLSERSYGAFERTIRLPDDVNRDKIDASCKDGILTVTVPKSPEAKKDTKRIPVHH